MLSSEEREQFRDEVRRFLTNSTSVSKVREMVSSPVGFDESLWSQIVDLGWLGMHVPEPYGAGADFSDFSVVLVEMGRLLTPSPVLGNSVLSVAALTGSTNEQLRGDYLAGMVDGSVRASAALANERGSYSIDSATVSFVSSGGDYVVSGRSSFVPDAAGADVIFVVGTTATGEAVMVAVDAHATGVSITPMPTIDQTRRLAQVTFDSVVVARTAALRSPGSESRELIDSVLSYGALAVSCDALGAADELLVRTSEYASARQQFSRPIGSFQAVKHMCANMAVVVVASRAAVEAASVRAETSDEELRRSASIVKSYASQALADACGVAIQVHGGIGFTWESDVHMFFKRAKLDEMLFGSPRFHRRRLARILFDG